MINIDAKDHVYLGSQNQLRIQTAKAQDSLRIKGQNGIYDVSIGGQAALQVLGTGAQGVILEGGDLGGIGTVTDPLTTSLKSGTLTARAGKGIYIQELNNDLSIASIFSSMFVGLEAQGSILNAADPASPVTIQANGLNLTAVTGAIGSVGNMLKVAVGPDEGVELRGIRRSGNLPGESG